MICNYTINITVEKVIRYSKVENFYEASKRVNKLKMHREGKK